jgi:hypothetical protein
MADHDQPPAKKPRKKPAAKKAAPRQTAAAKKRVTEQERALNWSVQHSAPLTILIGWDPDTGEWVPGSPIGDMLDRIGRGGTVHAAARVTRLRRLEDLVAKGREYLSDPLLSEDRMLIPIDIRPFVDLAAAVAAAESETELSAGEKVYAAIDKDPRLGLSWLARRFPDRWAEQQQLFARVDYDPRDRAVSELLDDPNTAMQMAEFARRAENLAAGYDVEE